MAAPFLILGVMMVINSHPTMLNYTDPTYNISETASGTYKIVVDVQNRPEGVEKIETIRKRILFQEAEKNPLCAMAFIQKLALDGDSQAQAIRRLYQAYARFLETPDKEQLKNCCDEISGDKNTDPLALGLARYISTILSGAPLDPFFEESRVLLNKLIPNIEQTLAGQCPEKMYEEQEITIPEAMGHYKAFPDILKYDGHYYVCFREANSHVGYNDFGSIRIVKGDFNRDTSKWQWDNVALLSKEGCDLRDPRFFVTHNNEVKISIGGSIIDREGETIMMVPQVASLEHGRWNLLEAVVDESARGSKGQWIWRVTWNPVDNKGYAFSYGKGSSLSLMRTADGIHFEKIADMRCEPLTDLSEATLRFKPDGTAIALIRSRRNGIIGTARKQEGYTRWSCNIVPFRIGGPNFIFSINGKKMWAATRHFFLNEDNSLNDTTIVALMNERSLTPTLRLKSGVDTSYPGMVLENDGSVTIVYYSSVLERKSDIFITRLQLPE